MTNKEAEERNKFKLICEIDGHIIESFDIGDTEDCPITLIPKQIEVKKMTNKEATKYLIAPTATSTKPSAEYLKQQEAYDLAIKALEDVERLKEENHQNFVNSQHIIFCLVEEIKKLRGEE